MRPFYRPMLFTSLTSAVGFASLSLADIPPVRVFGLFVAFGIMAAWLFSMTMVPAVISLMSDERLTRILPREDAYSRESILDRCLHFIGRLAFSRAKMVLLVSALLIAVGVTGVLRIQVNDNPVRWF